MSSSKIKKSDILSYKFRYSHTVENLGYEMYLKGKDIKLIVFYGRDEEHLYKIPRYWFIRHDLSIFDGFIETKEEFELVLKLLNI